MAPKVRFAADDFLKVTQRGTGKRCYNLFLDTLDAAPDGHGVRHCVARPPKPPPSGCVLRGVRQRPTTR